MKRSIVGRSRSTTTTTLELTDSIVDAGSGVERNDAGVWRSARRPATPETEWGAALSIDGMTCFGRMRVCRGKGRGGIFVTAPRSARQSGGLHPLQLLHGDGDRLPQHHGCVFGDDARLRFTSESLSARPATRS